MLGVVPTTGVDVRSGAADPGRYRDGPGATRASSGESAASTCASRRRRRARSRDAARQRGARSRPRRERSTFAELTTAFRTNLTALGLLALVVGMFLIYGTMAFAVLQRTQTLGILRTLGVSRGEILQTCLWETARHRGRRDGTRAAAWATCSRSGWWSSCCGRSAICRSTRPSDGVRPSPWIYVQGAALGLGATLLAAAKPALDAARIAPAAALRRAVLERRAHACGADGPRCSPSRCSRPAACCSRFGPSRALCRFAGLFGVLAAGALLTPLATVGLMAALDRVVGRRSWPRGARWPCAESGHP